MVMAVRLTGIIIRLLLFIGGASGHEIVVGMVVITAAAVID